MIKIDIWSDFVCPFCYIGKKQLDEAIKELGLENQVKINYMAYELHPDSPKKRGYSYMQDILNKYPSEEYVRENMLKPMIREAQRLGFEMKFDDLDYQNTFDAHRIAKYAKFYNKEVDFFDACYKEVFGENGFISDDETLVRLAKEVGLDETQVKDIIDDEDKFKDLVLEDEARAEDLNMNGVPFYIFNDKYAVNGAQGVTTFKEILETIRGEAGFIDLSSATNTCGPEGC